MATTKVQSNMENKSYWMDSIPGPILYSRLDKDHFTEVVIIGGGIAGVSVAYQLSCLNVKVILVEDGSIGSGETGHTTAHLVNVLDDRYYNLEKIFSDDEVKLIAQSHTEAINFIESTIKREKIDCEFQRVDGYLFCDPTDDPQSLVKEFDACKRVGLDVSVNNEIPGMLNGNRQTLIFRNQAQFNPLKYIKGLCDVIIAKGGKIFTETHAKEIDSTGITSREGYKVSANHVVIATKLSDK